MKKILVTGGAGYVGTTLVPMLLERGHDVTVIDNLMFMNGDRMIPFLNSDRFHFVKGDVRNRELMQKLVEAKDVVIHLSSICWLSALSPKGRKRILFP
jgi:nucleoside-diphosphate-sugar epimerase